MIHKLRRILLFAIQKTPFEKLARHIYSFLSANKGSKYDKETVKVIQKTIKRNSNCIDIGSYRGEILCELLKIAHQGKVFSFEPVPINHKYLLKKYKNALNYNLALSDNPGKASYYHVTGRPARSGLKKQIYPDPNEKINEIVVNVEKLDNVIPSNLKIDFIKIDVEGAEFLVMKGGEQLIKTNKPIIVFEHSVDYASQFNTTPEQIYDFLSCKCGLEISLMKDWLEGKEPFSRETFLNCVYSKCEFCFITY